MVCTGFLNVCTKSRKSSTSDRSRVPPQDGNTRLPLRLNDLNITFTKGKRLVSGLSLLVNIAVKSFSTSSISIADHPDEEPFSIINARNRSTALGQP